MEMIQKMEVRVSKESGGKTGEKSESVFHKVDNVAFCLNCGRQHQESELNGSCVGCGSVDFLKGDISATLAGYLKLVKENRLKNYYDSRFKKSAARMNVRRMIVWLLIKDGLMTYNDRKTEASIYKAINR